MILGVVLAAGPDHWVEYLVWYAGAICAVAGAAAILFRIAAPHLAAWVRHTVRTSAEEAAAPAVEAAQAMHHTLTANGFQSDRPTIMDRLHVLQMETSLTHRLLEEHIEDAQANLAGIVAALGIHGIDLPAAMAGHATHDDRSGTHVREP